MNVRLGFRCGWVSDCGLERDLSKAQDCRLLVERESGRRDGICGADGEKRGRLEFGDESLLFGNFW